MSPRRVIGAWPEWFSPLGDGAPPQAVLTGFVMQPPQPPTPEEAAVLERVRALPARPVVFTTGTVASSEDSFYRLAVDACRGQGVPGVLVTPSASQVPATLPDDVVHVPGAPFRLLLPDARAIVHHGGVGTCAEALAAGIPQVAIPMAGDHFDNAERVARLGVGRMLRRDELTARRLGAALGEVLSSAMVARRCEQWRARLDRTEGAASAADVIEQLGGGARAGRDGRPDGG
jgi:MGT family glycosyltransferase